MTVSNANRTSFEATTAYPQSYLLVNNTQPEMANKDVSFTADGVTYAAITADSKGFVSINYSWTGSKHTFEWASNPGGNTSMVELIQVCLHFGEVTSVPYPSYDPNADGIVDISDVVLAAKKVI